VSVLLFHNAYEMLGISGPDMHGNDLRRIGVYVSRKAGADIWSGGTVIHDDFKVDAQANTASLHF